jgi:hypothetical protein
VLNATPTILFVVCSAHSAKLQYADGNGSGLSGFLSIVSTIGDASGFSAMPVYSDHFDEAMRAGLWLFTTPCSGSQRPLPGVLQTEFNDPKRSSARVRFRAIGSRRASRPIGTAPLRPRAPR